MRALLAGRMGLFLLIAILESCCGDNARSGTEPSQIPLGTALATLGGSGPPCGTADAPPSQYEHVVWIWMENHSDTAIRDSPQAPYLNQLMRQCASASNYAAVGSPSLPNYVGATAGSTFGITDDADPSAHPLEADNLFRQVRSMGRTAKSYEESMPTNCSLVGSGRYAIKHNPEAYFTAVADRTACGRDDVPLGEVSHGELSDDLARDTLPTFAFVTPDLCNDTHDCPTATGDQWLALWMPVILGSPAYKSATTVVVVVFDEPTPMPNVFIAPSIVPGTTTPGGFSHYSLLRATEEMLGIHMFLGAAQSSAGLRAAIHF
jgi:hypothetical protein